MELNYKPPNTCRDFMLDDSWVRCIIGPLGCLSGRTEIMTPVGWKRIDEWNEEDILVWSPDGNVRFEQPIRYIEGLAPNGFIRFSNNGSLAMELSPDHTVPYHDYRGVLQVTTAGMMAQKPSRRTIPNQFHITETPGIGLSEAMLRLRVACAGDGHLPNAGKQCVITVRKQRKRDRIIELLDNAGILYNERIYVRDDAEEVVFAFDWPFPDRGKDLGTPEWYKADADDLMIILDEMLFWDGLANHEEHRFFTAKRHEADFIQYAAHVTGRRASLTIKEYPNKPNWKPTFTVQVARHGSMKNNICVREGTKIHGVQAADGKQYCFETSTGYFVARLDGCVFATGNSGKTMCALMELFRKATEQAPDDNGIRPTRFALVRNTAAQLRDTVLADIKQYFPFAIHKVSDAMVQFRIPFPDGTMVVSDWLLVPLERPEDQRKLLSLNLTGAFIEECREVPFDIVDAVLGRLGRYPSKARVPISWTSCYAMSEDEDGEGGRFMTAGGLIMVSNPWSEGSAYHEAFVVDPRPGWALFHQPGALEPNAENLENLPNGYYDRLVDGRSTEWVNVHVHSMFGEDQFGQAVYRYAFDRHIHVTRDLKPVPGLPIIGGIDFGRTPCCVLGQVDPFGRLLVLQEITSEDMGLHAFCQEKLLPVLHKEYSLFRIFIVGDPAGRSRSQYNEETAYDVMRSYGLECIEAPTNAIDQRLRSVEKRLLDIRGAPSGSGSREIRTSYLMDGPRCPRLLAGFMRDYRFRKKRDGDLEPTPEKNDASHIHDANQYLCLGAQSNYIGRRILMKTRPPMRRGPKFDKRAWT